MAYPLGSFQGGPDPNAPGYLGGRDAVTAALLAQQGFADPGLAGTQTGDANSMSMQAAMDALTGGVPGYGEGAPGAGMGVGRGASSFDPGGAMTTANAAMSGKGSGELGETGLNNPVGSVNPFGEGSATGRTIGFNDTSLSPFGGRGGGKEGFGEAISMGSTTPAGYTPSAQSFDPSDYGGRTAMTPDFGRATPNADIAISGARGGTAPNAFAGGIFDPASPDYTGPTQGAMLGVPGSGSLLSPNSTTTGRSFGAPDAVSQAAIDSIMGTISLGVPGGGAVPGGGGGARGGGGGAGYNPDMDIGGLMAGIMGNVLAGNVDLANMSGGGGARGGAVGGRGGGGGAVQDNSGMTNAMAAAIAADTAASQAGAFGGWGGGGWGGGGFSPTGGYEGSGSMSNTGGAQGFEGGPGAMGGGSEGAGGGMGGMGGADPGGGPGSGADPGGGVG
jgi:hypothetical protein